VKFLFCCIDHVTNSSQLASVNCYSQRWDLVSHSLEHISIYRLQSHSYSVQCSFVCFIWHMLQAPSLLWLPVQGMFYFRSAHLSLWIAESALCHTMHFRIPFIEQNSEIPIQLLPKLQMGYISPTGLANIVWIQRGIFVTEGAIMPFWKWFLRSMQPGTLFQNLIF
jgi:hypothetical protein